jgi:hypothetical protein
MRRIIVVALVAGIALSAGPIPGAEAGSRGFGPAGAYQCYLISDPSPGHVVDLTDIISGLRTVALGTARLYCAPVLGEVVQGPANPDYVPGNLNDHYKCYNLRSSKGDDPAASVHLSSVFNEETVAVGSAQLLCVEVVASPVAP